MKLSTMASVSISSSPVCSIKLQQQLSSSSLLSSSPNTSSSSSTTTLSPTSSSSNPNSTTPTHYNSHTLHSHHQIQLAQIQQHIAQQQQQQSHHISSNNSLSTASVGTAVPSLHIKKEPGLVSPPSLHTAFESANSNNNNSSIKNTMGINPNCNNNSPINTSNMTANNHNLVSSSTTVSSSNANSNEIFCGNNNIIHTTNSKCKRKINFSHLGIPNRGHMPATVARRNARERNRVKQVNNGFAALKQHIPLGHRSKKMSKVETLRCAVDYIKNLKTLLDPNGLLTSEDGSSAFDQFQFDFGMGSGSGGSTQQMSPTSSEDPSSPSYASEGSYVASSGQPGNNNNNNNGLYDYENYEPVSPEDEELLDAISWWQQS